MDSARDGTRLELASATLTEELEMEVAMHMPLFLICSRGNRVLRNWGPDCPPLASLGSSALSQILTVTDRQQMLSTLVAPLSFNAGAVPAGASARCAQLLIVGLAVRRWAEGVQRLR